jgi:hypothetical protein
MNPFAPPRPRNPNRLNVERLEDRNPASTTLDMLLADLWLSSVAAPEPPGRPAAERAGASDRRESPRPVRLAEPSVVEPPRANPTAEASRATRTESNLNGSRSLLDVLDRGFDLPFRGVAVSAKPAARPVPVVSGATWSAESPAISTSRATITPAVGVAAADDSSEPAFAFMSSMVADPSITLTPSTTFIPVNANRTSQSPWQKNAAGNDREGLPVVRDFDLNPMRDLSGWNGLNLPPPGPAIDDPDLKKMTATVTNANPGPVSVFVTYSGVDNNGGGLVRLWLKQSKEQPIFLNHLGNGVYQGILPNFPTTDFYVEGIRPSKTANDVKIKVSYTPIMGPTVFSAETTLTVTPVVKEFSVTPKEGGQVTFLKNNVGQIVGLNSGAQAKNGGWPDGTDVHPNDLSGAGAVFFAVVEPRTGIEGTPEFLQTIVVTNGDPSGVSLSGIGDYNMGLDGEIFPILDTFPALVPFYQSLKGPNNSDKVQMTAKDSPIVVEKELYNTSGWAGLIARMDVTYSLRLHLVWQFPDDTIFSLAKVDWSVVFRADSPDGDLVIDPASVITANPFELNNLNPARVLGPVFGEKFWWFASAG